MFSSDFRGRPGQLWKAFGWSVKGLQSGWRCEASFRLEVLLALVLVPAGVWLGHNGVERVTLILPVLLVLAVELVNAAIEAVTDRISSDFHELAGRAKDLGSAAVFVLLVATVLCWTLVLMDSF